MAYRKKLIEVALPLPEINDASAYDKMPGIGPHPKGIHHWWARLPLPTARAVLFASVVDDPSEHPERFPTEEAQSTERERLFDIIRRMMAKKLHEHPEVYAQARAEMLKHCDGRLPPVFDPFAGGGSIPLEASRLGFEAYAGDLNPVAVLLNKCNLELAPRWAGRPPVNPEDRTRLGGAQGWIGSHGLAADIRYYGRLIRDRARAKIGYLYPKVQLPKDYGGGEADVIAWLWARTVASPNPAAGGKHVPLVSTYWLSSRKGREVWLEPVVDKAARTYRFVVRRGTPRNRAQIGGGTKRGRGSNFECILTQEPIPDNYVRTEAQEGRLGVTLLATVASAGRGRIYLPADAQQQAAAEVQAPYMESGDMPDNPRWFSPPLVGMRTYTSIFTARQLTATITLSDLTREVAVDVRRDAEAAGLAEGEVEAYARAVVTFLALAVDRCADFNNALSTWKPSGEQQMHLFTRQAIPMVWDFAEANLLGEMAICWHNAVGITADAVATIITGDMRGGHAQQFDAAGDVSGPSGVIVSTDPPYYDNIGYAALSDFFYVWLRRNLAGLYPSLFSTMLAPKTPELTASSERFDGDKAKARQHFESGFRKAFARLYDKIDPWFPLTVYYAFKQDDDGGSASQGDCAPGAIDLTTGWEALLEALVASGFQITATWPVRASQKWRMVAMDSNALASYIVLACRRRAVDALRTDRRSFVSELKRELPSVLERLQQGNVAPVDFAQAAIGPGMAVYSRYSKVLEPNGEPLTVRTALRLINQALDEYLSEQEGDLDAGTRFALAWFEQHGYQPAEFGVADVLARAKNTSVEGIARRGLVTSRGGQVTLVHWRSERFDPERLSPREETVWGATHHLIRALNIGGEEGAARLLARMSPELAGNARQLAYRLYTICERKGWAELARDYNALVISWSQSQEQAAAFRDQYRQMDMF